MAPRPRRSAAFIRFKAPAAAAWSADSAGRGSASLSVARFSALSSRAGSENKSRPVRPHALYEFPFWDSQTLLLSALPRSGAGWTYAGAGSFTGANSNIDFYGYRKANL